MPCRLPREKRAEVRVAMLLSCYGSRRQAEQVGKLFCAFFLARDDARIRSRVFSRETVRVARFLTRKIWQDVRWLGADDDTSEAMSRASERSLSSNEQHGQKMIDQFSVKKNSCAEEVVSPFSRPNALPIVL